MRINSPDGSCRPKENELLATKLDDDREIEVVLTSAALIKNVNGNDCGKN
jgi:hypothetical protein